MFFQEIKWEMKLGFMTNLRPQDPEERDCCILKPAWVTESDSATINK